MSQRELNMKFSKFLQCSHVTSQHTNCVDLIKLKKEVKCCQDCNYSGLNLWVCLQRNCLRVGCSEQANDHSTKHYEENPDHCVHINVSSQRSWCYVCEREVFLDIKMTTQRQFMDAIDSTNLDSQIESDNASILSLGLVGLQNIANTCYMNSALQALSNIHPLTYYFLNCSDIVDHILKHSAHRCKAGLAKSYQRLIRDIWCNVDGEKEYIAPRSILYGIRSVHPMFRGYQQHDTQEFLRCFMDQLHEELKEQQPLSPLSIKINTPHVNYDSLNDEVPSTSSSATHSESMSDSEYESCDGGIGISEQPIFYIDQLNTYHDLYIEPLKQTSSQPSSGYISSSQQTVIRSIISDIFDGKLLSSVQCLTCDRTSSREETFQDLSLPIPNRDYLNVLHTANVQGLNTLESGSSESNDTWISWIWSIFRSWLWGPSVTLYDCMASFFSADELKGDNMYSCEKCNKLRTGIKYSQIMELPEVICIHLKRFRHDLSYSSKISSHVQFPLEGFDMRSYLHKDCKSSISTYNLVSVICHHGTVGGGHYTCLAKNAPSNHWYEYDDHHVTQVSADVVQNCQAYVLFYRKNNPQIELLRAEASELADLNPVDFVDIRFYVSREWLSRFNTFAEPGPINNWAILCPHGGILHSKSDLIGQIAVPISQPLWDFLYRKFGGGPAINLLFECDTCKRATEALARRQYYELNVFTKYNELDADVDSGKIFAISMPWLRKWQQFARGITSMEPGPINNSIIVSTEQPQSSPVFKIRPESDYAQLNAPLWRFLHGIYGGGPEIILRGSKSEEVDIVEQDDYEEDYLNSTVSDTESNIGGQHNHIGVETQQAEEDTKIEVASTEEKCVGLSSLIPTLRHRNHKFYTARTKIVPVKSGLRRKIIKSRKALRNSELFGASGNYALYKHFDASDNIMHRLANDFTDGVQINHDSKEHSQNPFQRPKHGNSHSRSKSIGTSNDLILSKTKQKRMSKNKEKVILQRYHNMRMLGEPSKSDV